MVRRPYVVRGSGHRPCGDGDLGPDAVVGAAEEQNAADEYRFGAFQSAISSMPGNVKAIRSSDRESVVSTGRRKSGARDGERWCRSTSPRSGNGDGQRGVRRPHAGHRSESRRRYSRRGIAPVEFGPCGGPAGREAGLDDVARVYHLPAAARVARLRTAEPCSACRTKVKARGLASADGTAQALSADGRAGRPSRPAADGPIRRALCRGSEDQRARLVRRWAERFATLCNLEFFTADSPTLIVWHRQDCSPAVFVLPIEIRCNRLCDAGTLSRRAGRLEGGTGYAFSHLRPAGNQVASTGAAASCVYGCKAVPPRCVSMGGGRRRVAPWLCLMCRTRISDFVQGRIPPAKLRIFSLSVGVTDLRSLQAGRDGTGWSIREPADRRARAKLIQRHLQALRRWRSRAGVSRRDQPVKPVPGRPRQPVPRRVHCCLTVVMQTDQPRLGCSPGGLASGFGSEEVAGGGAVPW